MFSILLRRAFGASADSVLAQSRRAYTTDITGSYIKETVTLFPATEINSEIRKLSDVGDRFYRRPALQPERFTIQFSNIGHAVSRILITETITSIRTTCTQPLHTMIWKRKTRKNTAAGLQFHPEPADARCQ